MRLLEFDFKIACSSCCASSSALVPGPGELGPIWISAVGGGLGRRGDMDDMLARLARRASALIAVSGFGKARRESVEISG